MAIYTDELLFEFFFCSRYCHFKEEFVHFASSHLNSSIMTNLSTEFNLIRSKLHIGNDTSFVASR